LVGGLDYTYKVKGDNQSRHQWIPAKSQLEALDALLLSISTEQLEIPESILALIPPRPYGYGKNRETFPSRTGPVFDPIAPAENVVDATFTFLFEAGRANRIYLQQLQNKSLPGFEDILDKVTNQVFKNSLPSGLSAEIKLMTEAKLVDHLIALSKNAGASQTVRALVRKQLFQLSSNTGSFSTLLMQAHREYLKQKIDAYLSLPEELTPQQVLNIPDGAPIGMEAMTCDFH
ncbi:MAG: peptidase, partial [Bacteroidetes bacterium]|nr:peptidase [Bacteroidota bacterium]